MMTLDEAWHWFGTTRAQIKLLGHPGLEHWDNLPWAGPLGKDEELNPVSSDELVEGSAFCLEHLNDFSVFESTVRERALEELRRERDRWDDALVGQSFETETATICRGSFARVPGLHESRSGAGLVEEVNQVRRYCNRVAHGGVRGAGPSIP